MAHAGSNVFVSFLSAVNLCANNPCKNGGKCQVIGVDEFRCQCAKGFVGKNCEKGKYTSYINRLIIL